MWKLSLALVALFGLPVSAGDRDLTMICAADPNSNNDSSPVEYYEYEYFYAMGMDGFVDAEEMTDIQNTLFKSASASISWCYDNIVLGSLRRRLSQKARGLSILSVGMGDMHDVECTFRG